MTDQIVIGAGFCRTGTASLQSALNTLELGPTYEMTDLFINTDYNKWIALNEAGTKAEEEKMLRILLTDRGYRSSVNFPSSMMFQEILHLSPEAKVLLSVRDSPEAWLKSAKPTTFSGLTGAPTPIGFSPVIELLAKFVPWLPFREMPRLEKMWNRIFLGKEPAWDDESLKQAYLDWIEHVKRVVPSDKLLVFNVKQGWEPLCKFLNVPVPVEPFPRKNDFREFQQNMLFLDIFMVGSLVAFYGGIGMASYYCCKHTTMDNIKLLGKKTLSLLPLFPTKSV